MNCFKKITLEKKSITLEENIWFHGSIYVRDFTCLPSITWLEKKQCN